jgi:integrase
VDNIRKLVRHYSPSTKAGEDLISTSRLKMEVPGSGSPRSARKSDCAATTAHTLRKTWGYHARMSGVDLALIMHKLNHNSLAYTKLYIGITDDELADVARKLNL